MKPGGEDVKVRLSAACWPIAHMTAGESVCFSLTCLLACLKAFGERAWWSRMPISAGEEVSKSQPVQVKQVKAKTSKNSSDPHTVCGSEQLGMM